MSKMRTALLAGAVVVGLGAVAGLAAFAPSLVGEKNASHELTIRLPGGGTETIAYAGKVPPQVTIHTRDIGALWPAWSYDWTAPSFVTFDPWLADMHRHLDMLASLPLLMSSAPVEPLAAADLSNLPSGTRYSMVSETIGNGVCTRYTQVTEAAGDTTPRIVSQTSGNCGTGTKAVTSQPTQAAKAVNLRTAAGPDTTQSM